MAETDSKTCYECEQRLPLASFRLNNRKSDGRLNICKPCLTARERASVEAMSPEEREDRRLRYRPRQTAWKQRNQDKVREYTARTREMNSDRHRRWRHANPDKWAAVVRTRDAKRRGGAGSMRGPAMREWTAAQKKVCHWCGIKCSANFHVDHIMPLAKGGKHEFRNLCIACPPCNQRKSAKDPIAFAQEVGLLL